jgi:ribonuclease T2
MARIAALFLLLIVAAGCGARDFDYYVLTLSWSPNFCANHDDPGQCQGNRPYSFVVHGLWPQYETGWPRDCGASTDIPEALKQSMLDIMPSPTLVLHEWRKHGQCTGLAPQAYFDLVRRAYNQVKIPEEYQQPNSRSSR